MDTITLSLEVLGGILGKSPAELTAAFKAADGEGLKPAEEVNAFVKTAFNTKIDQIKLSAKTEGKGFGTRTARETAEAYISENFNINEGTLEERLAAIKSMKTSKSVNKTLSAEEIRNSEIYKADVKNLKTALSEEKDKHLETKTVFSQKELKRQVKAFASEVLASPSNKFVLPQDEKIAKRWKDVFVNTLLNDESTKLALDDEGKLSVLKSDGTPLEDEHYNRVDASTWGVGVAKSLFQVAASTERETPNPATRTAGDETIKSADVPVFKDVNQYSAWIEKAANDPKVTTEMLDAAQQQLINFEN